MSQCIRIYWIKYYISIESHWCVCDALIYIGPVHGSSMCSWVESAKCCNCSTDYHETQARLRIISIAVNWKRSSFLVLHMLAGSWLFHINIISYPFWGNWIQLVVFWSNHLRSTVQSQSLFVVPKSADRWRASVVNNVVCNELNENHRKNST